MLYFMSKSWLSSPNCIGELSNFVNDILSSKIETPPSLVIVTLDGNIENDRKTIPWNLMYSKLPKSFHDLVKRYEDMDRFRVMDFASDFLSCVRYQCISERKDLDSSRIRLLVPSRTVFDLSLYVVFVRSLEFTYFTRSYYPLTIKQQQQQQIHAMGRRGIQIKSESCRTGMSKTLSTLGLARDSTCWYEENIKRRSEGV